MKVRSSTAAAAGLVQPLFPRAVERAIRAQAATRCDGPVEFRSGRVGRAYLILVDYFSGEDVEHFELEWARAVLDESDAATLQS